MPACGLEFADPLRQPGGRWYAELYGRARRVYRERWEFGRVAGEIEPGERLLELGCGEGRFLALAANRGARAVGVDPNPDALRVARREGHTIYASLEEVRVEFDWVCMFHTLEHLPDPRGALARALSRSRAGGRVAISVPSRRFYIEFIWGESPLSWPPHHMTSWSERSMRALMASLGLVEERLVVEPLPRPLFDRRYTEQLLGGGSLAPLIDIPRAKGLLTRLAMAAWKRRFEQAATGLTGKSMLAIYRCTHADSLAYQRRILIHCRPTAG